MNTYTDEQFKSLPDWAQAEIFGLSIAKNMLKKQLEEITGENTTNTFLYDGFQKRPMPKNSEVIFCFGEDGKNSVSVMVNEEKGGVDVSAQSRLAQIMVIRPVASNSFRIKFID